MARTQEARMERGRVTSIRYRNHGARQVQPWSGARARSRTDHRRVVTAKPRGRARG